MEEPIKWIKKHIESLSYKWPPRTTALNDARRVSKLPDKRTKWEYKCNHCGCWFKRTGVQVDHIVPKGRYAVDTFFVWLDRLFCASPGFQVLCIACHLKKTNGEKANGEYR